MKTNFLRYLRIAIIPIAFIIAAFMLLPHGCGGDQIDPAVQHLKTENDSLRKANLRLQAEKKGMQKALNFIVANVKALKDRVPEKTYKYNQTKEKGLAQIVNNPCDSAANVAAFNSLDKACIEVVSLKDSIIVTQDQRSAVQDSIIAVQEEQIDNQNMVDKNSQVYAKSLEASLATEKDATKRQRIKTWVVGIVGAAATALVTYFAIIKK